MPTTRKASDACRGLIRCRNCNGDLDSEILNQCYKYSEMMIDGVKYPPEGRALSIKGVKKTGSEEHDIYLSGLYIMLSYEGPEDSVELFQRAFEPFLRDKLTEIGKIETIIYLLLSELVPLDDWLHDLALST